MARARNIKPGFFKNEDLAECSPFARLCFAGLWTQADREGRLEDRPKRIKGELFPFDSIEIEPLLRELVKWGFVERYAANGVAVIQILKFLEHQAPHFKELPSALPQRQNPGLCPHSMTPKPEALPTSNEHKAPDKTGAGPPSNDTKAEEFQGETEIHPPLKGGSKPPESGSLNPDSLNLIPDTGEGTARKRAARKRADPPPDRPDDVAEQTWDDWTRLRKEKRASVSETVLAEAKRQAALAGASLERFLRSWCGAGWQGYTAKQFREREAATTGNGSHSGGYAAERNRAFGGEIADNAHLTIDEEKTHDIALPHARR